MLDIRNQMLCCFVLNTFGPPHQLIKLNEEMAELNQEVCKILLYEGPTRPTEHFREELADVAVMVQQAMMMFGISDHEINERARAKLERTIKEHFKGKEEPHGKADSENDNPGEAPDEEEQPADLQGGEQALDRPE